MSNLSRIGGWELDMVTKKAVWSAELLHIYEISEKDIPDINNAINFYEPYARHVMKDAVNNLIDNGISWDLELPMITAGKRRIWVRTIGKAVYVNNIIVRIHGTVQDITKRKTAEELVYINEQKFGNAFHYLGTGMALVSKEGKWIDVNPALCKILGYTLDELTALTFQDITYKEDLEKDLHYVSELLSGLIDTYQMEKRYIHKDKSLVWALLTVSLVKNNDGSPLYFISQVQNINERKLMENALIEKNTNLTALTSQLTSQNRLLEDFSHIVSHNLRSPSGNIESLLQFYKETDHPGEKAELINLISLSSASLSEILNELVDILKTKGKATIKTELLSFDTIFTNATNMLSGLIRESNADIFYDFQVNEINYSRIYLESAILNLMSNSLKYSSQKRKPVIRFKTFYKDDKICMEVSDNGIGIDLKKNGDKIFNMNQTFHQNKDAKGLGLYMTKTQIESLGGTISVESTENKGSIFTIQF